MCIAYSLCCAVETNATLYSNYTPTKINLIKKKTDTKAVLGNSQEGC